MVRRAGGELRGAGVDGLVDRPDARARPARAGPPSSPASSGRSAAIWRSEQPARLARRSSASGERVERASRPRTSSRSSTSPSDLVDEPRVDAAGRRRPARRSRRAAAPARRRRAGRRAGRAQRLERLLGGRAGGVRAGPEAAAAPVSVERIALCSASAKLRPIAMASPTLFIVVVSGGSAPGNFSKANRGILTTT